MKMPPGGICWPCIITGLGLSGWSGIVLAQDATPAGPSWAYIANGLFGLILLILGVYMKAYKDGVGEQLKALGEDLDTYANQVRGLEMRMVQNYHSKSDIREVISNALAPVSMQLNSLAISNGELHRKIDRMRDDE